MCYSLFPPRPASIGNLASSSPPNALTLDSSSPESFDRSYAQRRKAMTISSTESSANLLDRAQEKSLHETRIMTQGTIDQILDEWSLRIREKLGPIFGAAVVPFTAGLAKNVVDSNLAEKRPKAANSFNITPKPIANKDSLSSSSSTLVTTGRYTLQLHDFKLGADADALVQDLQHQNFSAYVVPSMHNSHLIYSVRVGSFDRIQDAQDASRLLQTMGVPLARVLLMDKPAAQPQVTSSWETHP